MVGLLRPIGREAIITPNDIELATEMHKRELRKQCGLIKYRIPVRFRSCSNYLNPHNAIINLCPKAT